MRSDLAIDEVASTHPEQDNVTGLGVLVDLCQSKNLLLQDLAQGEQVIGKILLTTYHSAKGREFDTVILPGLLQEIIPHSVHGAGGWRSPSAKELDEQRRTFYVAVTRAEAVLHLITGPGYHTRNGYWRSEGPSEFLREMAQRLSPPPSPT